MFRYLKAEGTEDYFLVLLSELVVGPSGSSADWEEWIRGGQGASGPELGGDVAVKCSNVRGQERLHISGDDRIRVCQGDVRANPSRKDKRLEGMIMSIGSQVDTVRYARQFHMCRSSETFLDFLFIMRIMLC